MARLTALNSKIFIRFGAKIPKLKRHTYICTHLSRNIAGRPTILLDGEVDDGGLGGDLGRVVRVRELGADVEPEMWVVLHLLVADLGV